MSQSRVSFEAPPLVETVLSVQFARLPGYSAAHAGWFWREYLEKLSDGSKQQWNSAAEAVKIPEQYERFDDDDNWFQPPFQILQAHEGTRMQLIRADGERLIQLQDNRFILNWRKQKTSSYPSFEILLPEFRNMLRAFEAFCNEARLGPLSFNQWEVVYVDLVKKGEMWDSARDWSRIFSGLNMPPVSALHVPRTGDEKMSADWRFSLANNKGRLYISLRQSRLQPSNEEVLTLTSTARGAIDRETSWEQGFEIGHEALRETFLAITSDEAQATWKKRTS